MSSSPPATLGKYQIIREIARSNDIVYEAYDPLMNRRVAVKELAMPSGANESQREDRLKRFLREARAAGSLQHPNIMTVFEVGEDAGRHFIAMEYLDGHTLRNEIDTKGFLSVEPALKIIRAVLAGLDYAHSKGVIHRDIKPDNIQLLSDGSVKLTDFGIARLTFEPNLTLDGQVFGTPSYMSPEQVVGREIDARSDLFSVGVVLYEMLSGQKPFAGDSVVSITYAIMNREPDRPQQVSYPMWQVLEKALDKSPQLRFANAEEFLKALGSAERATQSGIVIDPGSPQVGGTLVQPGANPYGGPSPIYPPTPGMAQGPIYGQPPPPPVVYPYNPYQQGGGAAAPHTPSYAQPPMQNTAYPSGYPPMPGYAPQAYTQAPIYYPPPPRRPIFKPETRALIGRIFLFTVSIGLVFAIAITLVNLIAKAASQSPASARTAARAQGAGAVGEIDRARQDYLASQTSDRQDAAGRKYAQLLAKQGQDQLASGDEQGGLGSLANAISISPDDPAAYRIRASYEAKKAEGAQSPDRAKLLNESSQDWLKAADSTIDPQTREGFRDEAAGELLKLAQVQVQSGDKAGARQTLYTARDNATFGGDTANAIEALLQTLRLESPR